MREEVGEEIKIEDEYDIEYLKRYKVLLLNDDYTSMDFVVDILMEIFNHPLDRAINIMLDIHKNGKAVCGIYTYEIAETKVSQVIKAAREQEYPLKAIMEEV